jgi:hypothetical protein
LALAPRPQWSIVPQLLAPIPYRLYINDALAAPGTHFPLFADDIFIYASENLLVMHLEATETGNGCADEASNNLTDRPTATPCGGGFEYHHLSPASRRLRRKRNPVPRMTGTPTQGVTSDVLSLEGDVSFGGASLVCNR